MLRDFECLARSTVRRERAKGNESARLEKSARHLLRGIGSCAAAVSLVWSGRVVQSTDHTKKKRIMDGVSFSIVILIGLDGCCMCLIFTYGRPSLEENIQLRLTG